MPRKKKKAKKTTKRAAKKTSKSVSKNRVVMKKKGNDGVLGSVSKSPVIGIVVANA
jgi:hypothetical protein